MPSTLTPTPQIISFWDLPDEIIDQILPEIELHRDLVSFACASKLCSTLVIPRHTEYRVLRIGTAGTASIWSHLARNAHLTCNFREVCFEQGYSDCPRVPSLGAAETVPVEAVPRDLEMEQMNIITAVRHMSRLTHFTWNHHGIWHIGLRNFTVLVLDILGSLGSLQNLSLNINQELKSDLPVDVWKIWRINGLRSLTLEGDLWHSPMLSTSSSLTRWLTNLSSLQNLSLTYDVIEKYHTNLYFPNLKNFDIYTPRFLSPGVIPAVLSFLARHNSLEGVSWSSSGRFTVPPPQNFLPNLKRIDCSFNVFCGLEITDSSPGHPLEGLSLSWYSETNLIDELCRTTWLDHTALHRLDLSHIWNTGDLRDLAISFPYIEVLSLPFRRKSDNEPHNFEELVTELERFAHLQEIDDRGLWADIFDFTSGSFKDDKFEPRVNERVRTLARKCPNLRKVSHPRDGTYYIRIIREADEIVIEVLTLPPWKPFDWVI